jgi:hypothetical protein
MVAGNLLRRRRPCIRRDHFAFSPPSRAFISKALCLFDGAHYSAAVAMLSRAFLNIFFRAKNPRFVGVFACFSIFADPARENIFDFVRRSSSIVPGKVKG